MDSQARQADPFAAQWIALLPLLLAWCVFLKILWGEWALYPQYGFGYLSLPLAAYLFHLRWKDRRGLPPGGGGELYTIGSLILLVLLCPLQILVIGNPGWHGGYWALGLGIYLFSLTSLGSIGGTPWLRHFAVPLLLPLFAIPLPEFLQHGFVRDVMKGIAGASASLVSVTGATAEREVGLIHVGQGGVLTIEEATSAVWATLPLVMGAVFLGERFRFSWIGRSALILCAGALAVSLNLVRSTVLIYRAASAAPESLAIRDPQGYLLAVIGFALLFALAWTVRRARPRKRFIFQPSTAERAGSSLGQSLTSAAILCAGLLLSWLWFARHEPSWTTAGLEVDWTQLPPDSQFRDIPSETRSALRYNDGVRVDWAATEGVSCSAFLFQWDYGRIPADLDVHRPEACLPELGLEVDGGPRPVGSAFFTPAGDSGMPALPYEMSVYQHQGRLYYVFYAESVQGLERPTDLSLADRIQRAWEGQLSLGRSSFELVLSGETLGEPEAVSIAEDFIRRNVRYAN